MKYLILGAGPAGLTVANIDIRIVDVDFDNDKQFLNKGCLHCSVGSPFLYKRLTIQKYQKDTAD